MPVVGIDNLSRVDEVMRQLQKGRNWSQMAGGSVLSGRSKSMIISLTMLHASKHSSLPMF